MTDSRLPDLSTVASPPHRSLDYEAVRDGPVVGRGGQAVVRRVELPGRRAPQVVAVKEPQASARTVDAGVVESFFEEARTWQALDERTPRGSPWADDTHVVGVVDVGDELPWIATEYMDGGSLASRLDARPNGLPLAEALWIGDRLSRSVKFAHDHGVAHLDLKPSNVLFRETREGTWNVPKIADWGLARVLFERGTAATAHSVEYAAPEQFDAERFGVPDRYTDIYQLGALVYALLTGHPPFTGSRTAITHDVVDGESLPAPSSERAELPPELDDAVRTALARDKADRYMDVGRFGAALRDVRTGGRVTRESRERGTGSPRPDRADAPEQPDVEFEPAARYDVGYLTLASVDGFPPAPDHDDFPRDVDEAVLETVTERVEGGDVVLLELAVGPLDPAVTEIVEGIAAKLHSFADGIDGDIVQKGDSVLIVAPEGVRISRAELDEAVADGVSRVQHTSSIRRGDWEAVKAAVQNGDTVLIDDHHAMPGPDEDRDAFPARFVGSFESSEDLSLAVLPEGVRFRRLSV